MNGKMEGHGTLMYSAGAKYVGEFVDGNMEGPGKLTWPDGDFKSGLFEADEFIPRRRFSRANGGSKSILKSSKDYAYGRPRSG